MSLFREAFRAMVLKDLRCPGCGEMNLAGAKPTIELDDTASRARCEICTREWRIETVQPKEK